MAFSAISNHDTPIKIPSAEVFHYKGFTSRLKEHLLLETLSVQDFPSPFHVFLGRKSLSGSDFTSAGAQAMWALHHFAC